jgi:hypothetical protein
MSDKLNTYHIDIKQPYKPYFSPPIIFLWHKTTDDSTDQKIEIFKFEWHDIRYTATVSSTIYHRPGKQANPNTVCTVE